MTDTGANSTYVAAATVLTQANIGVARQGGNPSSAFLYAVGNSSYLSLNGLSGVANLITTESNGDLSIDVGGSERMRIASNGALGFSGANYGTSGQVLTSNGSGSAPSWQTAGGLPAMTVTSSTAISAVAGNHYVVTGASTVTVTLPTSPSAGNVVWITIANGRVDTVVARNGQNINSLAENMTIDNAYAGVQLRFADATKGWVFT